jgi:hypothetical protein
MRNFIEEKMIQYFKTCSVDKYGQVSVVSPSQVFGNKTKDVLEYLKTDKLISIKTYGGRFGTYQGFSLTYDVLDNELRDKCRAILRENENYKWAMSH